VIDLLTLNPFDAETVLASVQKTGRAVIVHEATQSCGFGAEIAATLAGEGILHLRAPVLRVTAPDVTMPLPSLEEHYLPTVEQIRQAIDDVMRY